MNLWESILAFFGYRREEEERYYDADVGLRDEVVRLADREQRPVAEVEAELLAGGLVQQNNREALLQCWESLSPREQDVAALTCLGYTNKQIAAKLQLSPGTVKSYVRQVLGKYNLHSKDELRMLIGHWNYSNWGPRA